MIFGIIKLYKVKPDFLVCVEFFPSIIGLFYPHSRVIVHIHRQPELNYSGFKGKIFRFIHRNVYTKKTRFYGVSEQQSLAIQKMIKKKCNPRFTIPDNLSSKVPLKFFQFEINFISANRIDRGKGIENSIEWFKSIQTKLIEDGFKCNLHFYGNIANDSVGSFLSNNLNDFILYHGEYDNIEETLKYNTSVFINFSEHEGFGLVNYEYLALGVPALILKSLYGPEEIFDFSSQNDAILLESTSVDSISVEYLKSIASSYERYFKASNGCKLLAKNFRNKTKQFNSQCIF